MKIPPGACLSSARMHYIIYKSLALITPMPGDMLHVIYLFIPPSVQVPGSFPQLEHRLNMRATVFPSVQRAPAESQQNVVTMAAFRLRLLQSTYGAIFLRSTSGAICHGTRACERHQGQGVFQSRRRREGLRETPRPTPEASQEKCSLTKCSTKSD